ncbi:Mrp/NBP35 family ATP-binding protein [Acidocella sp.]|uniref:Mrp/NBP35 family ATP-binding protein n=1 Tax=Acidocella sp. TaxID=50710 RepID=UPI003D08D0E8
MTEAEIRAALTPFGVERRIDGISIKDGFVQISLLSTREEAARLEKLRTEMETTLRALPGVKSATIILTAHAQPQPAPQNEPALLPEVKHVIAVASGKGGVGKSTVAVNLAVALAQRGLKTGLLDADIYGPSLPKMLGLTAKPVVQEGRIQPLTAYGVKSMSIGYLVPEDKAMIWRGPMVMGALNQMLGQVEWGALDILVVDMPPGTGDAQLTLAQKARPSGAVIVSTPQDLALLDARRGIQMFEQVGIKVLGVVENMSYFSCPHCGHRTEIFGHGGARAEAEKIGLPFLGEIPLELAVRQAGDEGKPVTAIDPAGTVATSFRAVADAIANSLLPT